jgi:hypothetical protein
MSGKSKKSTMTSRVVAAMNAGKDQTKQEVCARIAKNCKISVAYARAWYSYAVSKDLAPGTARKAA